MGGGREEEGSMRPVIGGIEKVCFRVAVVFQRIFAECDGSHKEMGPTILGKQKDEKRLCLKYLTFVQGT